MMIIISLPPLPPPKLVACYKTVENMYSEFYNENLVQNGLSITQILSLNNKLIFLLSSSFYHQSPKRKKGQPKLFTTTTKICIRSKSGCCCCSSYHHADQPKPVFLPAFHSHIVMLCTIHRVICRCS